MQFKRLQPEYSNTREIAEVTNLILDGKTNNTGTIDLATNWATTTTIYNERISYHSKILLIPFSDAAEAATIPYGDFLSTSQQLAPSIGNTAVVTYTSLHESNGMYVDATHPSRIVVRNSGVYDIFFSLQLANANNDAEHADVWLRLNGNDVAESGRRFGLPARKSTGDPSHLTGMSNHVLNLTAGDYIEIAGSVSSTAISLEAYPAATTPYPRPAISSAQTTVQFIGAGSVSNLYVSNQQDGQATVSHFANNIPDHTYAYIIIG